MVGIVPHMPGVVFHAVADGGGEPGVVFHDEHARADAGDGIPHKVVVAIDINGKQVDFLVGDMGGNQSVDILFGDKGFGDLQLARGNGFRESFANFSDILGRPVDPEAGPILKEQGIGVVFHAIAATEFDKGLVGGANALEDFDDHAVFVVLGKNLAPMGDEAEGVFVFWESLHRFHFVAEPEAAHIHEAGSADE